jgi:hypothetical protein
MLAYIIANDAVTALLYIPSAECLVQTSHRIRGTWLIGNLTLESIHLDKKSKANRDLLDFIKRNLRK